MVQGDMEDLSSYKQYLQGVHGVFVNADCESCQLCTQISLSTVSLVDVLYQWHGRRSSCGARGKPIENGNQGRRRCRSQTHRVLVIGRSAVRPTDALQT